MSGSTHLFKNVAWISIGQITSKSLRAIFVLYAARIVGVTEYGIATYILAQLGLFTVLADCGVAQLVTRECARGSSADQEHYVRTGFAIKGLLATIMLLLLFISLNFHSSAIQMSETAILLTLVIFVCDSMKDFFSGVMVAREKNKTEALINLSTSSLLIFVGIPLMYLEKTSTRLLSVYAAASLLAIIIESIVFYRAGLIKRSKIFFSHMKDLLKTSYIFGLQSGFMIIIFAFDSIMIGWYLNQHALGLYGASQKLPLLLNMIPSFIAQGFLPELARSAHKDSAHFSRVLSKALTLMALIGIPIFIGGEIVADKLILSLFGTEYAGAPQIFRVLLGMNLFCFFSGILTISLYAHDKQKNVVRSTAAGAVTSIVGNLIMIPIWGIIGSAIASVLAQAVMLILFIYDIRSIASVKLSFDATWKHFFIAIIAMTLVAVGLITLNLPIIIVIPIAAATYGLIIFKSVKKLITT